MIKKELEKHLGEKVYARSIEITEITSTVMDGSINIDILDKTFNIIFAYDKNQGKIELAHVDKSVLRKLAPYQIEMVKVAIIEICRTVSVEFYDPATKTNNLLETTSISVMHFTKILLFLVVVFIVFYSLIKGI